LKQNGWKMKIYYEPEASAFMLLSEIYTKINFDNSGKQNQRGSFSRRFQEVVLVRTLDSRQEKLLQNFLMEMMMVEEINGRNNSAN